MCRVLSVGCCVLCVFCWVYMVCIRCCVVFVCLVIVGCCFVSFHIGLCCVVSSCWLNGVINVLIVVCCLCVLLVFGYVLGFVSVDCSVLAFCV